MSDLGGIFASGAVALLCISGASAWEMADETYSCGVSGMTLQELAYGGVTVISHTPATEEYCAEAPTTES